MDKCSAHAWMMGLHGLPTSAYVEFVCAIYVRVCMHICYRVYMLFIPIGIFIYYTFYIDVSLLYVIQNLYLSCIAIVI